MKKCILARKAPIVFPGVASAARQAENAELPRAAVVVLVVALIDPIILLAAVTFRPEAAATARPFSAGDDADNEGFFLQLLRLDIHRCHGRHCCPLIRSRGRWPHCSDKDSVILA